MTQSMVLPMPLSGIEITAKLVSRSGFDVDLPGILPTWVYLHLEHHAAPEYASLAVALTPDQARQLAKMLDALAGAIEQAERRETDSMGEEQELPRSAVSLVRELFEEVLGDYETSVADLINELTRSGYKEDLAELDAEVAEYRRRFKAIEDNLYSGPNSGY